MHFDWWTFALQTANFAVLVWLLHRFLYKPVLRMIEARRAAVDKQQADAAALEAEAKARLAEIEKARAGIAAEREAALKATATQAEEAARARQARAEREAAALLEETRKALAAERARAVTETRQAALDLALDIARRLLAELPAALRAEAWLEQVERHLAALPKAEVEALVDQFADGTALGVVTASVLDAETTKTWRTRLHRALGDHIEVKFETDPALIAGADLHFPSAILRFSWQSALARMRAEIESHGNAR
jgi:F-type H+-transporting ATPase subunit b